MRPDNEEAKKAWSWRMTRSDHEEEVGQEDTRPDSEERDKATGLTQGDMA